MVRKQQHRPGRLQRLLVYSAKAVKQPDQQSKKGYQHFGVLDFNTSKMIIRPTTPLANGASQRSIGQVPRPASSTVAEIIAPWPGYGASARTRPAGPTY